MIDRTKAFSGFSVNDIQKAREFYNGTLGLDVLPAPMDGVMNLKIGDNRIFVYQKDDHQAANFTILNFPVDNIETTVSELRNKGVQFENYDGNLATDNNGIHDQDGMKIAWFKDPAGNYLSLIEGQM